MKARHPKTNQALAARQPVAPPPGLAAAPGEAADCWNIIGVAGDGSCAELAHFVHCRNCPVYSAAGTRLLDRLPPEDYRRDLTEHFALEKKRAVPGTHSVVIFRIGAEWLALPTHCFREICDRRAVHSLPHHRRGVVLGLINLRGELLICVSLARLLGINGGQAREPAAGLPHRLVLAEWRGELLTFPVDEIQGIQRYEPAQLKPVPANAGKPGFAGGLLAWQDRMVGCLDAEWLFSTLNRSLK